MSVITYPLNNIEYTASDAELYNCTRTSGVYSSDGHFAITISGASKVKIGTGIAWIKNSAFAGKVVGNTAEVELTLDAAPTQLNRIDRIVIGYNATSNATTIYAKKGTEASTPTAPERSTTASLYELVLYDIYRAAGAVSITAANVTDQRTNEALCGIMRDGVTAIPTSALYAQFQALLEQMRQAIATSIPPHASTHAVGGTDALFTAPSVTLSTTWTTATTSTTPSTSYCSYYQEVSAAGVKANNIVIVGLAPSATATQREAAVAAQLFAFSQSNGKVVICVAKGGTKPTVAIPLQIVTIG